jgi:hypothetical protein
MRQPPSIEGIEWCDYRHRKRWQNKGVTSASRSIQNILFPKPQQLDMLNAKKGQSVVARRSE